MYTSCTTWTLKNALAVFISAHYKCSWRLSYKDVWQTAEEGQVKYVVADLSRSHAYNAPVMLIPAQLAAALCSAVLYFVAIVCVEPCDPLFGLLFHYLSKNSLHLGLKRRKAKWEPSVRCYKLRARPVARPREPDLAAPRLRRVKRCTQRSSLHLYAPYIGRLLLQPTGTWLLAS